MTNPNRVKRHWRYYVPGIYTRWKLSRRPLCQWRQVAVTWVEGKGQRNVFECERCDRGPVTVVTPADGQPFAYACKPLFLWPLRRKAVPNGLG